MTQEQDVAIRKPACGADGGPRYIAVNDADDPRIAVFRDIRERDLSGRGGFIAEGTVVVEQLLSSTRFAVRNLMILENRLAGVSDMLAKVPASVPIHVADRAIFDAIAGFPVHRGVMAYGEALAEDPGEAGEGSDAPLRRIAKAGGNVVVAVGIANHDNMGAIFRNAAAFGVARVLVDETACDPLYRKAIRVSAGSVLTLPFERVASGRFALDRLKAAGFRCLALSPSGTAGVASLERPGPVALFLGAEGPGLPAELMAEMETLRIDMAPGFDSLNVATTAAIALHRLYSAPPAG